MKKGCKSKQYSIYLIVFLIFTAIYPVLKTLVDVGAWVTTGRLIGTEDWLESIFLEKEKLALKPSDERRILIISGSNGLFGLSAEEITRQTGIKTINLSSHAGLGGEYILTRSKTLIREDDILLMPLEYAFYISSGISDDFKRSDVASRFIASYDRKRIKEISLASILESVVENSFSINSRREYIAFLNGRLSRDDISARLSNQNKNGDCYSGLSLNDYGDETCNIGKEDYTVNPTVLTTTMPPLLVDIDPGGYITRFVDYAQRKGAMVIPLYPTSVYTKDYEKSDFQASSKNIESFWENQGVAFQDSLIDSLLPPKMMYNTHYHAKDSGRQKRTESIIDILEEYRETEENIEILKN